MQDHRQEARQRFARWMEVPSVILACTVGAALTWPFWAWFDNLVAGKPIDHKGAAFLFMIAAIAIPAYLVTRVVAAAVFAAMAVRASAAGRRVDKQAAPEQSARRLAAGT